MLIFSSLNKYQEVVSSFESSSTICCQNWVKRHYACLNLMLFPTYPLWEHGKHDSVDWVDLGLKKWKHILFLWYNNTSGTLKGLTRMVKKKYCTAELRNDTDSYTARLKSLCWPMERTLCCVKTVSEMPVKFNIAEGKER